MDPEQTFASSDWNFPSPSATPTNSCFGNNPLQTPKTGSFPSHFQDAFSTPQMPGYVTPLQPQYASMTPVQENQTSLDTLRSNYYAQIQAQESRKQQPPSQTAYHAPVTGPVRQVEFQTSPPQPAMHLSGESNQMQTPPPTRGTSARKPQQPAQIAFGTPSTIASRRFMTPQQAMMASDAGYPQPLPMGIPPLQFSPDMCQFANLGPASAPVLPQTQLFWGETQASDMFAQQDPLDDPFASARSQRMALRAASPQSSINAQKRPFDTPAMSSFAVQPPHSPPLSAIRMDSRDSTATMMSSSSASLDPSLIYCSPAPRVVIANNRPIKDKIEQAAAPLKRHDGTRLAQPSHDSVPPTAKVYNTLRPDIRRNNTTGMIRQRSVTPTSNSDPSVSRSSTIAQIPRTDSPLKRIGKVSLGSISENKPKRASVVLKVDENGIARTETVGRRREDSPTRSIRQRYPGLFDSDTSEDECEEEERQLPSRSLSFTFAKGEERKSKVVRLDPPVENLEGIDLPRSSSRSSVKGVAPSRAAIAAAAQLRRQSSLRKTSRTMPSKRNTLAILTDSTSMNISAEHKLAGDGAERSSHPSQLLFGEKADWTSSVYGLENKQQSSLNEHNRRWSMMSFEQQHAPVQYGNVHPPLFRPAPQPVRASPVHIRCICGISAGSAQSMVQCFSCTQWLHANCIGVDAGRPPQSFICFLCSKSPTR